MNAEEPRTEQQTPAGRAEPADNSLGGRLEFLDALRGIAAMLVVVEHVVESYYPAFAEWSLTHFRLGEFGVVVFFLVSGFIIPASLERRGSLREFWIGRFFRLYPLYWACIAAIVVFQLLGIYRGLSAAFLEQPRFNTLVNLTMVQNFTSTPLAMGQSWTLAYEMAFYLLVSVLFAAGLHQRPAPFAAAGLGLSMLIGNPLKPSPLGEMTPLHWALFIGMVGVGIIGGAWLTRHRSVGVMVACAAVTGLVMAGLFNRPEPAFQAAFFLGTMFFGNCVYRWTTGKLATRPFILLIMLAFVAIVVAQLHDWSPWLHSVPEINGGFHLAEVLTYGGAYVAFLASLLYRDASWPAVLCWLGRISYSLYLVHSVVLYSLPLVDDAPALNVSIAIAASIAVSALTYRWIEQPAIALGRTIAKRTRRPKNGEDRPQRTRVAT